MDLMDPARKDGIFHHAHDDWRVSTFSRNLSGNNNLVDFMTKKYSPSVKSLRRVTQVHDPSLLTLTWTNVTVTVNGNQTLLNGVTGYAEPGRMLAIMGPSGSGKSTLLDSLSGRLSNNALLAGDILVNGRRESMSSGLAGYVTQDDTLTGTLTVWETLWYSACLRLGGDKDEKLEIVNNVIADMGLQDSVHTHVGNWHLRGVSGGEKRRLSIALEILSRPRILFLDEPTSGLDSASAYFVVETIKRLARDGRTVIAVIHQPSSDVFASFDDLFLLSSGRPIYFGSATAATTFFADAGFPCPPLRSPSDHYLRCINSDFDTVVKTLNASSGRFADDDLENPKDDLLSRMNTSEIVGRLTAAYKSSSLAQQTISRIDNVVSSHPKTKGGHAGGRQVGLIRQSLTLTQRSILNMSRDWGYYWVRLGMFIVLSVCIGTIFYKLGLDYNAIYGRASALSFVAMFLTFMSIGAFPSFVEDMKVFTKERLSGHYGVVPFAIANTLSSIPFLLLIALASTAVCYFLVGLHGGFTHFAYFTLDLFLALLVTESLMMVVSIMVPNFLIGIISGAGIMGLFLLVSGFFRPRREIPAPVWRYPLYYMSHVQYALQGLMENDFIGLTFTNQPGAAGGPTVSGQYVIENSYDVETSRSKWWNLAILCLLVFLYRWLFCVVITLSGLVRVQYRSIASRRGTKRTSDSSAFGEEMSESKEGKGEEEQRKEEANSMAFNPSLDRLFSTQSHDVV